MLGDRGKGLINLIANLGRACCFVVSDHFKKIATLSSRHPNFHFL